MSSCERCWVDSRGDYDLYVEMIKSRDCTPEQQAGEDAGFCDVCERKTIHQHTHKCVNPDHAQIPL